MNNKLCTVSGEEGVTLLEVLVAFVVTTLFLGMTYQSILLGLLSQTRADELGKMTNIAERQLAILRASIRPSTLITSGIKDDYIWNITITPNLIVRPTLENLQIFDVKLAVRHKNTNQPTPARIWVTTLVWPNGTNQ